MGTNSHYVDIRNVPGHNPPLNQYQLTSSGPNYYLWENKLLSTSLIEYTFNSTSSSLLKQHIQSYIWRHNNPLLVSTLYFKQEEQKEKYSIFYERVFTNLSRIKDLCFEDSLEFYYVGLKGFQLLFQHFGPFEVEEDMFHITQDSKVKIWCDHNISRIYPSTANSTQEGMIKQIIKIIEDNSDHSQAPVKVGSVLRQSSRSFVKVIQRFVRLCKQCNFHLSNGLKCLQTIYRGGVDNYVDQFAQSPNSKKQSFKNIQNKISDLTQFIPGNEKPTQQRVKLEQTKKPISFSSPKPVQIAPKPSIRFVHNPAPMRVSNQLPLFQSVQARRINLSPPHPIARTVKEQFIKIQPKPLTSEVNRNIVQKFYNVNFEYKNRDPALSPNQTRLTKRNIPKRKFIKTEEDNRDIMNTSISPIKKFTQTIKRDYIEFKMGQSRVISRSGEERTQPKQKQDKFVLRTEETADRKSTQPTYKSMLEKLKAKYSSISYNNENVPQFSYNYQSSTGESVNNNQPISSTKFSAEQSSKLMPNDYKPKNIVKGEQKMNKNGKGLQKPGQEKRQAKKYVPLIDDDIWKDMLSLKSRCQKS